MKKIILILTLLITLIIISCSSDKPYEPPLKVENTIKSSQENTAVNSENIKQSEIKIQTFNVGETATDGQLKITLNNVKSYFKIDELGNQFLVADAPSGKEYVVIDLSIENVLTDKTQSVSSLLESQLTDKDGFSYSMDFKAQVSLENSFKDGEILPGMKKRGKIAFLVPINSKNLKLIYKFDLIVGTSAVFNVGDAIAISKENELNPEENKKYADQNPKDKKRLFHERARPVRLANGERISTPP